LLATTGPASAGATGLAAGVPSDRVSDTDTVTVTGSEADGVSWMAALPTRPVRVVVAGDSTAESLGVGLAGWAAANRSLVEVAVVTSPGCGFVRGGRVPTDGDVPFTEKCDEVLDGELPAALRALRPDVVVLMVTERDVLAREWDPGEGLVGPGDPRFRARVAADYAALADVIRATGATAVWVRAPEVVPFWRESAAPLVDPADRAVVESVVDELVDRHPGSALIDLRAWMEATGLADDHAVRPDGLHFTPEAATAVATEWVGPHLLRLALDPERVTG
jgi:hypothetical protein